jgi:ribosomal protein L39E
VVQACTQCRAGSNRLMPRAASNRRVPPACLLEEVVQACTHSRGRLWRRSAPPLPHRVWIIRTGSSSGSGGSGSSRGRDARSNVHRVFWLERIGRVWRDSMYAVIWWFGRGSRGRGSCPLGPRCLEENRPRGPREECFFSKESQYYYFV